MRLDVQVAKLLGVSRNRAQFFIESGFVSVLSKIITKVSHDVENLEEVEIQNNPQIDYVSRSAQKLSDFIEEYKLNVKALRCLDVGASTGGFTQTLLKFWAEHVTALDVGTLQLHDSLRWNLRITSIENMDIRKWESKETFPLIVVDVSFISLQDIFADLVRHLSKNGEIVLLFKPQFEVGRENLTKWGVPKSESIRSKSVEEFQHFLIQRGVEVLAVKNSTLLWESGNQEVLFWVKFPFGVQ